MSDINDGGPAFPVAESHHIAGDIPWTGGMTLRDYFAGQALVGHLADGGGSDDMVARWSYATADAMLAERDEKGGE